MRMDDSHLWDPVGPGVPAEGFSLIHRYSLHLPGRVTSMQKQSLIFPCIYLKPETKDSSTSWFPPEIERSAVTTDLGCLGGGRDQ